LQEALERTLRRWGRVAISEPEAYVRTAMVNALRSRWRPRRFRVISVAEAPEVHAYVDGADVIGQREELFAALRQITPKQRAIVVFRYWQDLSEATTAEIVGCSVGTVKSQASRGLQNLRTILNVDDTFGGAGAHVPPISPRKGAFE
jgi:RNA polymerase sigma-70 factor (sigma-E family)